MSDDPAGVDQQKALDTASQGPVTKADTEKQQAAAEFKTKAGKSTMLVHIHSPFRDYYEGQAFSLSAENATGPFDILPHHHNFISLLLPCDIVVRTADSGEQRIRISGGIVHVKSDKVVVFLDV